MQDWQGHLVVSVVFGGMERCTSIVRSLFLRTHSNTVKKRIFGSKKHYEEIVKPMRTQEKVLEPLKYPPSYTPSKWLPNGWSPPPEPEVAAELRQNLPFQVQRTVKGNWLPVYTDIRKGRTQVVTMVRKASGDLEEMRSEMSRVCEGEDVQIRSGRLEVKGRYSYELRQWLAGLGF